MNKLKVLREINNFTQQYIGQNILGISQTSYGRLEQNPLKINVDQAKKLAELYKVDFTDLLVDNCPIITFKENNRDSSDMPESKQAFADILLQNELKFLKEKNQFLKELNTQLFEVAKSLGIELSGYKKGK
jgi:DNA-binding XRE family transcriptional regulator